ncbi:FecR domain-containing protein [uncultured Brachyspira sp.]|uniref:FecR domain-containing protein n=1 Tax=uncultured Brachyspira sp. TaxID=221953 RepID=UPI0025D962A2|nr:FecR domain-containing protein [uncultured Brachyspira sp.]
MCKKMIAIIFLCAFALNAQYSYNNQNNYNPQYNHNYMEVVSAQGEVKITSKDIIAKPANIGDLLFSNDRLTLQANSYLTYYIQNNSLFKLKQNASLNIDESLDRNNNIKFTLSSGEIIAITKLNSINIITPNANISMRGTVIIANNNGATIIKVLSGSATVNNNLQLGAFMQANISNTETTTGSIVLDANTKSYLNEIINLPYANNVAQVNFYINIASLPDNTILNVNQSTIEK